MNRRTFLSSTAITAGGALVACAAPPPPARAGRTPRCPSPFAP